MLFFSFFNVYGKENKIFLGDSGAMTIGFVVAIMTLEFMHSFSQSTPEKEMVCGPAIAFSIVIVPVLDLTRVFVTRLFSGKSPFIGDKNHLHHSFVKNGYSHFLTTLIISVGNMILIVASIISCRYNPFVLIFLIATFSLFIIMIPRIINGSGMQNRKRNRKPGM